MPNPAPNTDTACDSAPAPFDFAAADLARFTAQVDAVIAKGEMKGHQTAIRNVQRMIARLGLPCCPSRLHVTDLLDGQARLERSARALAQRVDA